MGIFPAKDGSVINQYALTDDPIFQQATTAAKSIARKLSSSTLTPLFLLAGFSLTARRKTDPGADLSSRREALDRVVANAGLKLDETFDDIPAEKFPLSDDLRKILAAKPGSLAAFLDSLLEIVSSSSRMTDPAYLQILAYASASCIRLNMDAISPEIFSASGYIAFTQGALPPNLSLSTLFLNNHDAFEALINDQKLNRDIHPEADQRLAPISQAISKAIDSAESEGEKLLASLDVGLKTGHTNLARRVVAYHEAGHAIVSAILRPSLAVTKVTIAGKDDADGMTSYDPNSPYWDISQTKSILEASLATVLAGRAAQRIKFGNDEIDAGASSDIESATDQAWRGVALFGLDEELGPVNIDVVAKLQGHGNGWIFDLSQRRVHALLNAAAEKAEQVLRANWNQVEIVVEELLSRQTVNELQFAEKLQERSLADDPNARRARSRPIIRRLRFAQAPGILQTQEGPVCYAVGDPIIEEPEGSWPAGRTYVERFYRPQQGLTMGQDGDYTKESQNVLVLQLKDVKRLDMPNAKGVLRGKAGDWLVDYGQGEFSIVGAAQFSQLYELDSE